MAKVLRDSGRSVDANELLYFGHNRALWNLWNNGNYVSALWMFLFRIFVGYGYRTWYSIIWAGGLVIVWALMFRRTKQAMEYRMPFGLAFSFDRLLPLIKLREIHYKIDFNGWSGIIFIFIS